MRVVLSEGHIIVSAFKGTDGASQRVIADLVPNRTGGPAKIRDATKKLKEVLEEGGEDVKELVFRVPDVDEAKRVMREAIEAGTNGKKFEFGENSCATFACDILEAAGLSGTSEFRNKTMLYGLGENFWKFLTVFAGSQN